MKNFIILSMWFFTVTCLPVVYGQTISKEKKISGRFSADKGKLVIDNRFGRLDVKTWDKNEVTVDVTITTRANSDEDAQRLLDEISIEEPNDKNNGIYYKTVIGRGKEHAGNNEMHIDYVINMPRRHTAEFTNKFGDIEITDVSGKLTIDLEYGALNTGAITGKDKDIKVGFGSAVIPSIETGTIRSSYSKLSIDKAGSINVSNQFEKTTINSVTDLDIEQKYGDLKIGSVSQLKGNVQFAGLVVDKLLKSVQVTIKNGTGTKFEYVGPNVDNVDINSSFSNLYLHFDNDASLAGDVNVSFGNYNNSAPNVSLGVVGPGVPGQAFLCRGKIGAGHGILAVNVSYGNVAIK